MSGIQITHYTANRRTQCYSCHGITEDMKTSGFNIAIKGSALPTELRWMCGSCLATAINDGTFTLSYGETASGVTTNCVVCDGSFGEYNGLTGWVHQHCASCEDCDASAEVCNDHRGTCTNCGSTAVDSCDTCHECYGCEEQHGSGCCGDTGQEFCAGCAVCENCGSEPATYPMCRVCFDKRSEGAQVVVTDDGTTSIGNVEVVWN